MLGWQYSDPSVAILGSGVWFEVIVSNSGNETAVNATIVDHLPLGWKYVRGTSSVNGTHREPYLMENNTLVWILDSLAPGNSILIRYKANVGHLTPPYSLKSYNEVVVYWTPRTTDIVTIPSISLVLIPLFLLPVLLLALRRHVVMDYEFLRHSLAASPRIHVHNIFDKIYVTRPTAEKCLADQRLSTYFNSIISARKAAVRDVESDPDLLSAAKLISKYYRLSLEEAETIVLGLAYDSRYALLGRRSARIAGLALPIDILGPAGLIVRHLTSGVLRRDECAQAMERLLSLGYEPSVEGVTERELASLWKLQSLGNRRGFRDGSRSER